MKYQTYILQFLTAVLMISCIASGYIAALKQHMLLVVVNIILFGVNAALFIWQQRIRNDL